MKSPLLTLLITLNYAHTLGMKNSLMKRDSIWNNLGTTKCLNWRIY